MCYARRGSRQAVRRKHNSFLLCPFVGKRILENNSFVYLLWDKIWCRGLCLWEELL